MKNEKNDLPVSDTKKELHDRLKATMQKEAQEASEGTTRRGFLHAVIAGGATLGLSAIAMKTPHALAGNASCPEITSGCQGQGCLTDCQAGCEGACLGGSNITCIDCLQPQPCNDIVR